MSERPSWDSIWMQLAWTIAERSTCSRLKVGCVIVTEDNCHVIANGYNGNYRGGPNACDSDEIGKCGCFPPNVKVLTDRGEVRIQKIKVGDMVLTHRNRYRRVARIMRRDGAMRDHVLLKIKGRQGRFVSTADHPVMVRTISGYGWVQAGDLNTEHMIAIASKKCSKCQTMVPRSRRVCHKCYRIAGQPAREAQSRRMKENNPMQALYGPSPVKDNSRVRRLVEKQKAGQLKLEKKLFEQAEVWKSCGYGAVVVDHTRNIPDIVVIDWNNKKVIAYEYERRHSGIRMDKYDGDTQYDEIFWHTDRITEYEYTEDGLVWMDLESVKRTKSAVPIYNMEVEEDQSYICQNVAVHNCIHAEANSLLKLRYTGGQMKIAYITHICCRACAKMLVNADINRIVYQEMYRDMSSLKILEDAGLGVSQYEVGE